MDLGLTPEDLPNSVQEKETKDVETSKLSSSGGTKAELKLGNLPQHKPPKNAILAMKPSPTIIVFVNSKSGGQQGKFLFDKFQQIVGVNKVFDLMNGGPSKGLEAFKTTRNLRILVAGGDGSVGWVLATMDKLQINPFPPIAVLPLGTGNDLARTLKWGGGYSSESLQMFLRLTENAETVALDRWNVRLQTTLDGISEANNHVMNNYFSLGTDAQIALKFHTLRNDKPDLFKSQIQNKMWYVLFGSQQTFKSEAPLNQLIELEVDGDIIPLSKNLTCLVVLNLSSYGGGNDLWGTVSEQQKKKFSPQSFSDGVLEVIGIKGAFSLGANLAGLGRPKKLVQGRGIQIRCNKSVPLQVDGEPWQENPCLIKISLLNQARMLLNKRPL